MVSFSTPFSLSLSHHPLPMLPVRLSSPPTAPARSSPLRETNRPSQTISSISSVSNISEDELVNASILSHSSSVSPWKKNDPTSPSLSAFADGLSPRPQKRIQSTIEVNSDDEYDSQVDDLSTIDWDR